jgi:hypothetical protein
VKVRIKETPREPEVDGVRLDRFQRGDVREVSPSIGSWLIAEGYAEPEMRQTQSEEFPGITIPSNLAHTRRANDR